MLPQVNAQLTRIAGGGVSEDEGGGYSAGADTTKWSGLADAYVSERVETNLNNGLEHVRATYVVIPDLGVTVTPEDTITYDYDGATKTRTVEDIEAHTLPGHTPTIRLVFWDR